MNKRQILASLNDIANKLDNSGLYNESNTITNVMVKISQVDVNKYVNEQMESSKNKAPQLSPRPQINTNQMPKLDAMNTIVTRLTNAAATLNAVAFNIKNSSQINEDMMDDLLFSKRMIEVTLSQLKKS
jgi:hypothetical protein